MHLQVSQFKHGCWCDHQKNKLLSVHNKTRAIETQTLATMRATLRASWLHYFERPRKFGTWEESLSPPNIRAMIKGIKLTYVKALDERGVLVEASGEEVGPAIQVISIWSTGEEKPGKRLHEQLSEWTRGGPLGLGEAIWSYRLSWKRQGKPTGELKTPPSAYQWK